MEHEQTLIKLWSSQTRRCRHSAREAVRSAPASIGAHNILPLARAGRCHGGAWTGMELMISLWVGSQQTASLVGVQSDTP